MKLMGIMSVPEGPRARRYKRTRISQRVTSKGGTQRDCSPQPMDPMQYDSDHSKVLLLNI